MKASGDGDRGIKLIHSKFRGMIPESESEKKALVDLLIHSVVIHAGGSIDVFYNFRETKPMNHIPLPNSTTSVGWSTILNLSRTLVCDVMIAGQCFGVRLDASELYP